VHWSLFKRSEPVLGGLEVSLLVFSFRDICASEYHEEVKASLGVTYNYNGKVGIKYSMTLSWNYFWLTKWPENTDPDVKYFIPNMTINHFIANLSKTKRTQFIGSVVFLIRWFFWLKIEMFIGNICALASIQEKWICLKRLRSIVLSFRLWLWKQMTGKYRPLCQILLAQHDNKPLHRK